MTQFGDDHVEAFRGKIKLIELFNIALEKAHIAASVTEALPMPVKMGLGRCQLLVGHVDPDDLAVRSGQLRQNVGVAPRARAEIEHAAAAELCRHDDAAAVIFGGDLGMDIGEQRLQVRRQFSAVATG